MRDSLEEKLHSDLGLLVTVMEEMSALAYACEFWDDVDERVASPRDRIVRLAVEHGAARMGRVSCLLKDIRDAREAQVQVEKMKGR